MVYRLYFMLLFIIDLVQLIRMLTLVLAMFRSVCRLYYAVCHTPVDFKTANLIGLMVITAETL